MPNITEVYSDRSTCVTQQGCPRKRWFTYEHPNDQTTIIPSEYTHYPYPSVNAPGVVPAKLNLDTTLGSAFHVGVYHLLNGASQDEAVGRALEGDTNGWDGWWPSISKKGANIGENESTDYVYNEHAALIEALVRGYSYVVLPNLLANYNILETEYDESAIFSDVTVPNFQVRWGIRTDGLLEDKVTGQLYVLSLKTAKQWRPNSDANNRRDMQGITEAASVQQRLKRWHQECDLAPSDARPKGIPEWYLERYRRGLYPEISGVKMEFALKGYRSDYPKGSGQYKYSNSLIRAYKRAEDGMTVKSRRGAGNTVVGGYAISWEFMDAMGANHTLGKGWRITNMWEEMGIKNWMEYLMENEIQGFAPGHAVEQQFIFPPEYTRDDQTIQSKIRQLVNQEYRVHEGRMAALDALANRPEEFREKLDIHFPMHADYPSSCSYCPIESICYGPESYLFNPLAHPGFEARTSNHGKSELFNIGGD